MVVRSIGFFVAIIFLASLLSFRLAKGVTKPLADLTEGVNTISKGNLGYRIELKTGDEIEELGNDFNQMAKELGNRIKETEDAQDRLAKSNEELKVEIAERKRMEEALRDSEEKLRKMFESATDGISVVDLNGVITEANQRTAEVHGFGSKDELLGKSAFDLVAPSDHEKIAKNMRKALKQGTIRGAEYTLLKADGSEFPGELSTSVLKDASGNPAGHVTISRDITERKQAEEEREQLLQQVEDKKKELEQIIYVTSHDLRSPLVNIQGFTRELEQALQEVHSAIKNAGIPPAVSEKLASPMDEDIPDALRYILTSTSKIDSLLSGLLRLSRLGRAALNMEKLDMNELMANVTHAFEYNIKDADVTMEVRELPSCLGDKTQINQVFSNLIDNALKYLAPNRPGIIGVSGREEDGQAIYCVQDNGIGIAPEYQQRVFEIFQRLEPRVNFGDGLGLTIVRRILDRHSGKIWLESEPGKGSKFFVSLPAA